MGFKLIGSGGGFPITRRERIADGVAAAGGAVAAALAPGDAYVLIDTGSATRARRFIGSGDVSGIVEAVVLTTDSGPTSHAYVPGVGAGSDVNIIGIEDYNAEFEVQADAVVAEDWLVDKPYCEVADTAPNTDLGQSRQQVDSFNASASGLNFKFLRLVDRVDNAYGQDAKIVVRMLTPIESV
jgi:hypothetical protein